MHAISSIFATICQFCAYLEDIDQIKDKIANTIRMVMGGAIEDILQKGAASSTHSKAFLESVTDDLLTMCSLPEWTVICRYIICYMSQILASSFNDPTLC